MHILELRIPPVVVTLVFGTMMWLAAKLVPSATMPLPDAVRTIVYVLVLFGGAFALTGVLAFYKAATTVNPHTPKKTSSLVVTGVYRYSRNPMYLGLLLLLAAWVAVLANGLSVAVLIGFVPYMNRFQIRPEERALTAQFGREFERYASQVRRWL